MADTKPVEIEETFTDTDPGEMAHCALINFDNVVKMNPALGKHPIFMLARGQLVSALRALGRDPE